MQSTAPRQPVVAGTVLDIARHAVTKDRNATHGEKERSFAHIASMWNAYLASRKRGPSAPITALDVSQMMVLLKIVRANQGTPVPDQFIDAAGYSAVSAEIMAGDPEFGHLFTDLKAPA